MYVPTYNFSLLKCDQKEKKLSHYDQTDYTDSLENLLTVVKCG